MYVTRLNYSHYYRKTLHICGPGDGEGQSIHFILKECAVLKRGQKLVINLKHGHVWLS